jgi:hypothetical protein
MATEQQHSALPPIPILSAETVQDWTYRVRGELASKKVWGIVSGTRPQPAGGDADAPKYLEDAECASGIIMKFAGPQASIYMTDLDDPQRMWADLQKAYNSDRPVARIQSLQSLLSIKQKSEETLDGLAHRVSTAHKQFISLQPKDYSLAKLNEELFAASLTAALGVDQKALQTNILFQDKIRREDLLLALRDMANIQAKEASQAAEDTALAAAAQALLASRPFTTSSAPPPLDKSRMYCDWCKTYDSHITKDCNSMERARTNAKSAKNKGKTKGKGQGAQVAATSSTIEFAGTASRSHSHSSTPADTHWNPDTGATSSMTPHKEWLCDFQQVSVPVRLGDGSIVFSSGIGKVWFEPVIDGRPGPPVCFTNVLHVPALKSNLLSVFYLTRKRHIQVNIRDSLVAFLKDGVELLNASIDDHNAGTVNGRTLLQAPLPAPQAALVTLPLLHLRFNHRSPDAIKEAVKREAITGITLDKPDSHSPLCAGCIAGKHSRNPFPPSTSRSTQLLELVHTDLHGPLHTRTPSGYQYWILFIDDYSRYRWICLLKNKSDAFAAFQQFKAYAEKHTGKPLMKLRDDKGGEYMSTQFDLFMKAHGIQRQHTVRATPQQNGVVERANRDLGEGIVSMLSASGAPNTLWGEAAHAFVHTSNRFPSRSIGPITPYELWHGSKPDVSHLRTWGCVSYVHLQKDQRLNNLAPHSLKCIFIGYGDEYKAWRFWSPSQKRLYISRDVIWAEDHFYYPPRLDPPVFGTPASLPEPSVLGIPHIEDAPDDDGGAPAAPPAVPQPVPAPVPAHPEPVTPPRVHAPVVVPPPLRPKRTRYKPQEFWRVGAPLVPHSPVQEPPSPTPARSTVEPASLVEDSDSSEDPIDLLATEDLEQGLLAMAGITKDGVLFTLDEAIHYAYSASTKEDSPTFKEAMHSPHRDKWLARQDSCSHREWHMGVG